MAFRPYILVLAIVAIVVYSIAAPQPIKPFQDDGIISKIGSLKLRNGIGYHMKKTIRQVSQELFISRKLDVSYLLNGIETLKTVAHRLSIFCSDLSEDPAPKANTKPVEVKALPTQKFRYLNYLAPTTFAEARARCTALGMQLPEVYSGDEMADLVRLLKSNGIDYCHAGVEYDLVDGIIRFIATGAPIWRGYNGMKIYNTVGGLMTFKHLLDDNQCRIMYHRNATFMQFWQSPTPGEKNYFGRTDYRSSYTDYEFVIAPVVCQDKWDGLSHTFWDPTKDHPADINIKVRNPEKHSGNRTKRAIAPSPLKDLELTIEVCRSVALHANETSYRLKSKVSELLALIDITVYSGVNFSTRDKRSFLAKIVFKSGVKMLWNLYGFVQQIRTERKLKKIEKELSLVQAQTEKNSELIDEMSSILYGHSIAISQLSIFTQELKQRLDDVEFKVDRLSKRVDVVETKIAITQKLQLINSLILRSENALDDGTEILQDIIHSSALGQTSPILLPRDQIEKVQREIQRTSYGILDVTFSKMQSLVVNDPNDPTLLLVIINAVALDTRKLELITLTSIPHFDSDKARQAILSYQTVALDEWSGTYIVLNEQETTNCLVGRCYISGTERPISDKSCGMPQFYNNSLTACEFEESQYASMFLHQALPDGAFFAFKDEVTTQLFCRDNQAMGGLKQLSGYGIIQLPNGCSFTVTNRLGVSHRIKGPPMFNLVNAEDVVLVESIPLGIGNFKNGTQYRSKAELNEVVNANLDTFINEVGVTKSHIANQYTYIWAIIGVVSLILLVKAGIVITLYYCNKKFRDKLRKLGTELASAAQKLMHLEIDFSRSDSLPPVIPPKPSNIIINRDRYRRLRVPLISVPPNEEHTYVSLSEIHGRKTGSDSPKRTYPRITPLMKELINSEEGIGTFGFKPINDPECDACSIIAQPGARTPDAIIRNLEEATKKGSSPLAKVKPRD